jgi:hypothetical protein
MVDEEETLEELDTETEKESILSKINKKRNNIIVGAIILLSLVLIVIQTYTQIISIIIIVLTLFLLKLTDKQVIIEHEPAKIFNDVANSFTGEQFGIKDIRYTETFDVELNRPKIRIQTISQDYILFLLNDKTLKPIGILCKKKYKEGEVPLLDLFSSDVVEVDVPEIIRLSERDLYGQRNRELKFVSEKAKDIYKKYKNSE